VLSSLLNLCIFSLPYSGSSVESITSSELLHAQLQSPASLELSNPVHRFELPDVEPPISSIAHQYHDDCDTFFSSPTYQQNQEHLLQALHDRKQLSLNRDHPDYSSDPPLSGKNWGPRMTSTYNTTRYRMPQPARTNESSVVLFCYLIDPALALEHFIPLNQPVQWTVEGVDLVHKFQEFRAENLHDFSLARDGIADMSFGSKFRRSLAPMSAKQQASWILSARCRQLGHL